jgi:hypothetical protein
MYRKNKNGCVFVFTGDQFGGLDGHHVLHSGRAFLLGLDLFRSSHCGKFITSSISIFKNNYVYTFCIVLLYLKLYGNSHSSRTNSFIRKLVYIKNKK